MNRINSTRRTGIRRGRLLGPDLILLILLGVILVWMSIALAADRSPEERQYLMRMWTLTASGFISVAMPHILYPQQDFRLYLLTAPTRQTLLFDTLRRASPLLLLMMIPPGVMMISGGAWGAKIAAAFSIGGVWGLAIERFVRLGAVSQGWQDGTRGAWYRKSLEVMSVPPAIPHGSIPTILATTGLFTVAIAGVVLWSALAGTMMETIPSLALLWIGLLAIGRLFPRIDAESFRTQAFFVEIFRMYGGKLEAEREAVPYESIYWAPRRLRPAIWSQLVQMDRRAPLGRLIAVAHVLLYMLMWSQGYDTAVAGYLLMFSLAKNMAPAIISSDDASPPVFNRFMQSSADWIWTRTFMSLRWTLPWIISLSVIALFSSSFPAILIMIWTAYRSCTRALVYVDVEPGI